ncbi:hypothetical protein Taro_017676 [Colocasia esculenta]|uniref:Glycosyltransferase n=1 Tax=Colocasia esculenta TaxID=4460 RepID=A0A843URQ8_COLES|nr:hypothetical protein [Colocasia esculenta]
MDPALHHVVALPYPGRGHVNPMLNLGWARLRFRTLPNVIPSEHNRGADYDGFLEAVFTRMEVPFEELLKRLLGEKGEGDPPVCGIISDTDLPWAVAVGNRREIPVYSLFTMSACFFSVLHHIHLIHCHGQPLPQTLSEKRDENLDFIPGITSLKMADICSVCSVNKSLEFALQSLSWVNRAQCLLLTTFYELEPRSLDALKQKLPLPIHAVGPSIPYLALEDKLAATVHNGSVDAASYYSWLDSQTRGSVLYVSLGSFLSVSGEQMDEIARGQRASGVRFLWVARRDAARMQELGGGAGLVVPWCDQLKVLCHPAVGGFLTHCGWNSTLEAVYAGVPMLTLPIFLDQPLDSRLIVDEWKTGLNLKGEAAEDSRVVGREEIARTVQRLMESEGEESKELRRRAGELKEACRRAVQVGGSSMLCLVVLVTAGAFASPGDPLVRHTKRYKAPSGGQHATVGRHTTSNLSDTKCHEWLGEQQGMAKYRVSWNR